MIFCDGVSLIAVGLLYMERLSSRYYCGLILLLLFHIWTESESDRTCCFTLPLQPVVIVTYLKRIFNWTTHLCVSFFLTPVRLACC